MDGRSLWGVLASLGLVLVAGVVGGGERCGPITSMGATLLSESTVTVVPSSPVNGPSSSTPPARIEARAVSEESKPCLAVQADGGLQATCLSLSLPAKKGQRVRLTAKEGQVLAQCDGLEARANCVILTSEGGPVLELVGKARLHSRHDRLPAEVKAERIVVNLSHLKAELQLEGSEGQSAQGQPVPRAKEAATMPPYRIEPPDILYIDVRKGKWGKCREYVAGEHLVTPDGTLNLGTYGSVSVAGLTIAEAKAKMERHLSQWVQDPVISLSVVGYNSKVYYVVIDAGSGQQVFRLPITGNETVLDAVGMINGLSTVMSKKTIWVERPDRDREGHYEVLPVNWRQIVHDGDTATNYQLLPGDRVNIKVREVRQPEHNTAAAGTKKE